MWKARGNVPAEHCPGIERATRARAAEKGDPSVIVTCEELRPDVAWGVLRDQSAAPTPPNAPAPPAPAAALPEREAAPQAGADLDEGPDNGCEGQPHTPIAMGVDMRSRDRELDELRIDRALRASDKPSNQRRER